MVATALGSSFAGLAKGGTFVLAVSKVEAGDALFMSGVNKHVPRRKSGNADQQRHGEFASGARRPLLLKLSIAPHAHCTLGARA